MTTPAEAETKTHHWWILLRGGEEVVSTERHVSDRDAVKLMHCGSAAADAIDNGYVCTVCGAPLLP